MMQSQNKIFQEIEQEANDYVVRCLVVTAIIGASIWVLNLLDVFTVSDAVMNTTMPLGIMVLICPAIFIKAFHAQGPWVKYCVSICFILGIGIMHTGMTYQVVLAWACPIFLSCHYYSPKVTIVTCITSVFALLGAMYAGLYFGSWDANITKSIDELFGFATRQAFIQESLDNGVHVLLRTFNLYYIPIVLSLLAVYFICNTLSKRTHGLADKQQKNFLERSRIGAELSVATEIQASMLPNTFPPYPEKTEFDLHASMTPSKEVGGDFYDYFFIDDDHLALVIADVSGKGVPAAMFMMATKIMLKNKASCDKTPAQVLAEVNMQLCQTNKNDMFVTVWFGIYELSTGKITAANAGHEYPVLQRNGEDFQLLKDKHGFVIGGMEHMKYRDYELQLNTGDTLFLYTDGVLEAIDEKETAYGTERLLDQLNKSKEAPLSTILSAVKEDVDVFANTMEQFDDITMLAIRRN